MRLAAAVLVAIAAGSGLSGQTRVVPGTGSGRGFSPVWNGWSVKPIVVYVDDGDDFYIRGGAGQLAATGPVARRQLRELIDALKRGQAQAGRKATERPEESRELASFFRLCADGRGRQTGIALTLAPPNQAGAVDLALEIRDLGPPFGRIVLHLDPVQVTRLIALLEKVPVTHQELLRSRMKPTRRA